MLEGTFLADGFPKSSETSVPLEVEIFHGRQLIARLLDLQFTIFNKFRFDTSLN